MKDGGMKRKSKNNFGSHLFTFKLLPFDSTCISHLNIQSYNYTENDDDVVSSFNFYVHRGLGMIGKIQGK